MVTNNGFSEIKVGPARQGKKGKLTSSVAQNSLVALNLRSAISARNLWQVFGSSLSRTASFRSRMLSLAKHPEVSLNDFYILCQKREGCGMAQFFMSPFNRSASAGLMAAHFLADWLLGWSLAAKWARLLN